MEFIDAIFEELILQQIILLSQLITQLTACFLLVLFPQMLTYFAAFEVFFEENLPKLFAHFKKNNLTPDIYLIDW